VAKHLDPAGWPRVINSRDVMDLLPTVRQMCAHFMAECTARGIDVIITSTFRDYAAQAELYAQGRSKPGRIVTNAAAGWSWHNHRCAFDVVPLRHGKPVWGTAGNGIDADPTDDDTDDLELWQRVGECGELAGLEWAGRWTRFREFPHFQYTYGRTIADMNRGASLPEGLDGTIYTVQTSPTVHSRMLNYVAGIPQRVAAYFGNGKGDRHG